MNLSDDTELSVLDQCDKEPIHIPGQIQNFAVLIALDNKFETITHCSANATAVFNCDCQALIGAKISDYVSSNFMHDLNNALSLSTAYVQRERVGLSDFSTDTYEIWAHYSNGCPVLEFELQQTDGPSYTESVHNITALLSRLKAMNSIDDMFNYAVQSLRDFTGFDRVMFYQFDQNGDGEVKAESKGPNMEAFFGLRFPRWDIPKQSRQMMVKIPVRTIANTDIEGTSVELLSNVTEPLDLSIAASRGQSPVHSMYLRNMGVGGTMTLSIVVNGELWGLFALHHQSPRCLSASTRGATELFIQFFTMMLEQHLINERALAASQVQVLEQVLFSNCDVADNFFELITDSASALNALIEADGVAIVVGSDVSTHGLTPPASDIDAICTKIRNATESATVSSTTSLMEHGFSVAPCAGALVVSLSEESNNALVFFRQEAEQTVNWAGAPDKEIVDDNDGPRLIPRGSFKAYKQAVKNHSKPWEINSLACASEIRAAIAKAEFKWMVNKIERQNVLYIDELNHRVRNIFALVSSLVRRTKEKSLSLDEYVQALDQRFSALSAAHDLAVSKFSVGVSVAELFHLEAEPYVNDSAEQLIIHGQLYSLRPDNAPIFALITHELMTNCFKYGSLSVPGGKVNIHMGMEDDQVAITWKESGGPPALAPNGNGFGMSLITEAVPYELDGQCDIKFEKSGLEIKLLLPQELFTSGTSPVITVDGQVRSKEPPQNPDCPASVLIVEDSLMVAIDMSEMLTAAGVTEVQKCSNVSQAKVMLESFSPDFALLDISLRAEKSFAIATLLYERNIPFCFATGYGSKYMMPEELRNITVLTKPVDRAKLELTMKSLYKNNSS